jgi:cytochrome c5
MWLPPFQHGVACAAMTAPNLMIAGLFVGSLALLAGCGASATPSAGGARTASVPAYVTEPLTPEQRLIEQGAPLMVADGCSACHLNGAARTGAPSFASFAGHRVRLADGRGVLVDERFVREGLLDPRANELRGYDPAPMLVALARLRLASHPRQVAALAAFIEQVGPEP